MAKRLQHRGGTTSQHSTFTGAVREVTVDTDKNTLVVHDGATAGGHPLATATNFQSTGIDDNASSTAITIDSSENVGIGTSSPEGLLEVGSGNRNALSSTFRPTMLVGTRPYGDISTIDFNPNLGIGNGINISVDASKNFIYYTVTSGAFSERMRIDSSGNVGIGTSSPDELLTVALSGSTGTYFEGGGTPDSSNIRRLRFTSSTTTNAGDTHTLNAESGSGNIAFATFNTERMRIDRYGRVFVNATSPILDGSEKFGVDGGHASFQFNSNTPLLVNRTGTDGPIISIRKDGTVIGSMDAQGDDLVIYSSIAGHCGLRFTDEPSALPTSNFGFVTDNSMDLGRVSNRYDDIFATNGTIQTSDQNEKQSIQSLTNAEMNVAKRLSPLIKTFKWNSAVEEKGDNARTHTGIIAQDVQQAFTDEGLDASNYALFISDTWWEKEISVEATKEKDAYSYIDTKKEATDGYTERTRLGVRYPELLSFIQAYNDQRFTELEARITALETQP